MSNALSIHKNEIPIKFSGQSGGICRTGIPLPKGMVHALHQLRLNKDGAEYDCFARPLCFWEDGSIRWINVGLYCQEAGDFDFSLIILNKLQTSHNKSEPNDFFLECTNDTILIHNADFHTKFDLHELTIESLNNNSDSIFRIEKFCGSISNTTHINTHLDSWSSQASYNLADGLCSSITLELSGHFDVSGLGFKPEFKTILEAYSGIPLLKFESVLYNPSAAEHPNGIWDLGDNGSFYFNEFFFDIANIAGDSLNYKLEPLDNWKPCNQGARITQYSSGGKNWQSPVHVDHTNQVRLARKGYELITQDGTATHGERTSPLISSTTGFELSVEKFWQNFPMELHTNKDTIRLALFPDLPDTRHELQGGERKSHTFWIKLNDSIPGLEWIHSPSTICSSINWLSENDYLALRILPPTDDDRLQPLINNGLEHEFNFFNKREVIDEYGWRNFGDLYADHEKPINNNDAYFPSHYNNQYDPLFGFLRQFLINGDNRWYELAIDLARHIKDIDIYRTTEDKDEYNFGLFWHTDHYLKAYTSSHRSHSKLQEQNAYEGHAGGGGPGGQHCYTTGLTLHFLLTGNIDSRNTVFNLTNWISHVYEGSNTILGLLLSIKKRSIPGLKDPITGQYPLDRGTANYINALLDCYLLNDDAQYLFRVEDIIANTVHPNDDINKRNLDNIEEHWFYTVLLQAVCRYLTIKEQQHNQDRAFLYARAALLHYADWMLEHEYNYLAKPEILEFPNDTWTAQELRKVHILSAAYYYSPDRNEKYLNRGRQFYDYIVITLSKSEEKHFTRILSLLMQNQGGLEYYSIKSTDNMPVANNIKWPPARYQSKLLVTFYFLKIILNRILNFSIRNEISWLKKRIDK